MVLVGRRLLQLRCGLLPLRVRLRLFPVQYQLLAQPVLRRIRQLLSVARLLLRRLRHLRRWLWQLLWIGFLVLQLGRLRSWQLWRRLRSCQLRRPVWFGLWAGLRTELWLLRRLRGHRLERFRRGSADREAPTKSHGGISAAPGRTSARLSWLRRRRPAARDRRALRQPEPMSTRAPDATRAIVRATEPS